MVVEHAGDDVAVAAQRRVGAARERGAQRAEARDEHAAGARELAERPLQPHALEHVLREVLQEQGLVDDALQGGTRLRGGGVRRRHGPLHEEVPGARAAAPRARPPGRRRARRAVAA